MDNFVKEKLMEWSLEEYSTNFESEGIDEESFKLIDGDTLKILIPKAGPRLKFKARLEEFLSFTHERISDKSISENIPSSELINSSSLDVSISQESQPSTSAEHSTVDYENERCIDLRKLVKKKLPELLKKLDGGDPTSISILNKYSLNRLIVDKYIEKYDCRPTTKEKIDLAKSIIRTFPVLKSIEGEGFEQWFCPGVKGTACSGFIATRFRNFRKRKLSSFERCELGIGLNKSIKNIAPLPLYAKEDTSVEFLQKQQWLKENDQPLDQILKLMKETFEGRRFQITSGCTEGDVVKSWPRLLNPQVTDAEFREIYGNERCDSLCLEFGLIAQHIILQAKNCGRKEAEELANTAFDVSSSSTSIEKINCAILLLPFLLPQGVFLKQKGAKKIKVRPTATQSLDHFIQFIPIGEGIDKFMKEDRLLGGERKQPFILAIGNRFHPAQTFIIFEEHIIPVNSLLKAVDICFKLTYVFNLEFSVYVRNVWHFINEVFFKCEFKSEIPSCILELKNRLFVSAVQ